MIEGMEQCLHNQNEKKRGGRTILLVTAVFPPEPVVSANLSYDIAMRLHNIGEKVVVVSPVPSRPQNYQFPKEQKPFPFIHEILKSFICPPSKVFGRFRESYSFGKATQRYIKQHHKEIGIIYANTWPLFGQFYLIKAAKKFHIPCYIHVQDIYPDSLCQKMPHLLGGLLYRFLIPIDKYVLGNATGVFAISPSMKEYISRTRGVDLSKIILIRNWQDDRVFIDAHKPVADQNGCFELMYLGSINPTADVPLIIKAFSRLDQSKFKLSIIGNGPDKDNCQKIAFSLGIDIAFDTVAPEQVAIKQSEADALVLCLKKGVAQTATPSKLTAYMLTGRPIIASVDLDSDCANIIREAGCGLVVEPGNEIALRDAVLELSKKTIVEINKLGRAAFTYAVENLSKERNLNKLVDVLIN